MLTVKPQGKIIDRVVRTKTGEFVLATFLVLEQDGELSVRLLSVKPAGKGRIRAMNWQERISVNPAVRSGKPCVKGTRITVYDVLEYLAGGMSEDQVLGDFPDLTRDDIRACPGFAAARERRLVNSVA